MTSNRYDGCRKCIELQLAESRHVGVLIGVDSVGQLQDNLRNISERKVELSIDVKEKELLNPGNWK